MRNNTYAAQMNIKRFQNLLDTSVDADERQTIQRLLAEEKAKAEEFSSAPKAK